MGLPEGLMLYLFIRFYDGIIGVRGFVGYKLLGMGGLNGFCR